jgi:hypothetical protein
MTDFPKITPNELKQSTPKTVLTLKSVTSKRSTLYDFSLHLDESQFILSYDKISKIISLIGKLVKDIMKYPEKNITNIDQIKTNINDCLIVEKTLILLQSLESIKIDNKLKSILIGFQKQNKKNVTYLQNFVALFDHK